MFPSFFTVLFEFTRQEASWGCFTVGQLRRATVVICRLLQRLRRRIKSSPPEPAHQTSPDDTNKLSISEQLNDEPRLASVDNVKDIWKENGDEAFVPWANSLAESNLPSADDLVSVSSEYIWTSLFPPSKYTRMARSCHTAHVLNISNSRATAVASKN